MKILQVINSLKIGGAEKLIVDIVPLLRNMGHHVDVCLFDGQDTNFKKILIEAGINIISLGYDCNIYNPKFAFKLARIIGDYDIIHTHNTAPQMFAILGSYFSKCKLVTTEHSTSNRRRNYWYFRYIDKWMYSRYEQIICISEPSEESLRSYIGVNYPIITIKNGINIQKFKDAVPIDLGVGNCKKITMVAGFRYEKDQSTLIKAIKLLPEDYHLILIGDGVKRSELEALIIKEEVEERVHLLGLRGDVPNILKSSDVIVMSSHREGLSLSNIEGMCSGRPFVASDVEGLREVTKDYGILFPHEDAKALSEILFKLCTDKVYAEEVVFRCQQRAMQYDIQIMVDAYNRIYENITNTGSI